MAMRRCWMTETTTRSLVADKASGAAPASGSGKTLVTAGLLRLLRERGVRVAAAKAGPDYIDPTFHAAASGDPAINPDPWAMRQATLAGLVRTLEAAADIVICEGVM